MTTYFQILFPMPGWFRILTEEDYRRVTHPKPELSTIATWKCIQAGTAIGTCYGGYLALSEKASRTVLGLRLNITRMGRRGFLAGLLLGPAMTHLYVTVNEIDFDGMSERCYRLRRNQNQLRTHRWMFYGGMFGQVLSNRYNQGRLYGLLWGITVSVLAVSVYNGFLNMRTQEEKKEKTLA